MCVNISVRNVPLGFDLMIYTQHTLGWFTYAYCHGKYVKQFREAPHAHPHPPGKYVARFTRSFLSLFVIH